MSSKPLRLGIFGGSFDPVHNAHLALANAAFEQLHLDQLRWVPTGEPWHKSRRVSAANHREAMVRLAIAGHPGWVLERCELERAGPSYTVDTVRELQRREAGADWFLIIGRDQFEDLAGWHGRQALLPLVTLAVADRPGVDRPGNERPGAVPEFDHLDVILPPMPDSSTGIRQRLAEGRGIGDLVPPAVAGYIDQHHLYTEEQPRS